MSSLLVALSEGKKIYKHRNNLKYKILDEAVDVK